MENSISYLKNLDFSKLPFNQKLKIKAIGRPIPHIVIEQSKDKSFVRLLDCTIYEKSEWLCGCEKTNALYCFPCILLGGEATWTSCGVNDLRNLPQKIKRHEMSIRHMNNVIDLSLLGGKEISVKLESLSKQAIDTHNELVRTNRIILSHVIDCMKFCGKFELPLIEKDKMDNSKYSDFFFDLVAFAAEKADAGLVYHFTTAKYFKAIQEDLLNSIFAVCKRKIKDEVNRANYLAVICNENADTHNKKQFVVVLRYELEGQPVERFWGFFNSLKKSPIAFEEVLIKELQFLIPDCPDKLIAVSGLERGDHDLIRATYPNAHYIHCYAHKLESIVEKATSGIERVKIFFNNLSGIPTFFSKSPLRITAIENVGSNGSQPSTTRWNSKDRLTLSAIRDMKDAIIQCCNLLEASNSCEIGYSAASIKRMLTDPEFLFWLKFFSKIMPQVELLISQFQSKHTDAMKVNLSLEAFAYNIHSIREECELIEQSTSKTKKRKCVADNKDATAACECILQQCRERLGFINHLEASKLLLFSNLPAYEKRFPHYELEKAVNAYPMLEKDKLRAELSVLYSRRDMWKLDKILDLLSLILDRRLETAFSETLKLLKILITTPLTTDEEGRCFSTFNIIKKFLNSSLSNERLTSLGMLSIENKMISSIRDFNEEVIKDFVSDYSNRKDFIFK